MKQEEENWEVNEPIAPYGTSKPYLMGLKSRLIQAVDESSDEDLLMRCLEMFHADTMPCQFTEEEFDEEIRLSEASGFATDEEIGVFFEKYGHKWEN